MSSPRIWWKQLWLHTSNNRRPITFLVLRSWWLTRPTLLHKYVNILFIYISSASAHRLSFLYIPNQLNVSILLLLVQIWIVYLYIRQWFLCNSTKRLRCLQYNISITSSSSSSSWCIHPQHQPQPIPVRVPLAMQHSLNSLVMLQLQQPSLRLRYVLDTKCWWGDINVFLTVHFITKDTVSSFHRLTTTEIMGNSLRNAKTLFESNVMKLLKAHFFL